MPHYCSPVLLPEFRQRLQLLAAVTGVGCGGLKTALGALAVPALTLPFCAVATGCYLLGDSVPGLKLR